MLDVLIIRDHSHAERATKLISQDRDVLAILPTDLAVANGRKSDLLEHLQTEFVSASESWVAMSLADIPGHYWHWSSRP